jgi:hypothetical protein
MNKSAQSPDYYPTYPIATAVRTQLNTTIPEGSDIYTTDDTNSYATPAGLYAFSAFSRYEHEIPVGMGKKNELGRVRYES